MSALVAGAGRAGVLVGLKAWGRSMSVVRLQPAGSLFQDSVRFWAPAAVTSWNIWALGRRDYQGRSCGACVLSPKG